MSEVNGVGNDFAQRADSVKSLFEFVREFSQIRKTVTKDIRSQKWHLYFDEIDPSVPGVKTWTAGSYQQDVLLSVERADVPPPPELPVSLRDWMVSPWDSEKVRPSYIASRIFKSSDSETEQETEYTINFEESEQRKADFELYVHNWEHWAAEVKLVNENHQLFTALYSQKQLIEASNLRDTMALGTFFLASDDTHNSVNHPVLTQNVSLELIQGDDGSKPVIRVLLSSDEKTTFNTEVLTAASEDDFNLVLAQTVTDVLDVVNPHPMDLDSILPAIKNFAVTSSLSGTYVDPENRHDFNRHIHYNFYARPVLFVRERPTGVKQAIDQIVQAIEKDKDGIEIPQHLIEIVCGKFADESSEPYVEPTLEEKLAAVGGEDPKILMAKPANSEQLRIAQEIERNQGVIVQGPPGTGKTHTIANLLGHFLAQGKRVLVTSYTTKALSVLKDKLPEEIQPLCVSLIDGNKDLEYTVSTLSDRMATLSAPQLNAQIKRLEAKRTELQENLLTLRKHLASIRFKELKNITYQGEEFSLKELALWLRENQALDSVIPGKSRDNEQLPLTIDELKQLYQSNRLMTKQDELELSLLDDIIKLSPPENVQRNQIALSKLKELQLSNGVSLVTVIDEQKRERLAVTVNGKTMTVTKTRIPSKARLSELLENFRNLGSLDQLDRKVQQDSLDRSVNVKIWDRFIDLSTRSYQLAKTCLDINLSNSVSVKEGVNPSTILDSLIFFKGQGLDGAPTFWQKLRYREHCDNLNTISINGHAPSNAQELQYATDILKRQIAYQDFSKHWNQLVGGDAGISLNELGEYPEIVVYERLLPRIKDSLSWYDDKVVPMLNLLKTVEAKESDVFGCDLDRLVFARDKYNAILSTFKDIVIPAFEAIARNEEIRAIESALLTDKQILAKASAQGSELANGLLAKFDSLEHDYILAFSAVSALQELMPQWNIRRNLLARLGTTHSAWAQAISSRDESQMDYPEEFEKAWKWRQLNHLFNEYLNVDYDTLQQNAIANAQELRSATAELVAALAWMRLYERLNHSSNVLQQLERWRFFMKKVGKGKGKKAEENRQYAREAMKGCQKAIPVWVMPLDRALTSFDCHDKFDIVIIDEASQADLSALPILHWGKKVIVVGDDKQVSPMAIGIKDDLVNALSNRYLKGKVQEYKLYQSSTSLYDIAKTTYRSLMLREHFRCVPKIIGFSNGLSYNQAIKPLRPASSSKLVPSMIAHHVDGVRERNDVNKAEAQAIIDLMKSCMAQPEYDGKTFGVIVMRTGSSSGGQAKYISQKIYESFTVKEIEDRKILCGLSSEFQGDERDVIFLSLVDSGIDGQILRKETDGVDDATKKRYNVAVSRAKDQVWVIHSFDGTSQLQTEDIRRRLLSYVHEEMESREAEIKAQVDSVFEERVALALAHYGYRSHQIIHQYQVGNYRIDMVIRHKDRMVALECDGDQYHSSEEQIQNDMERQTILERNGWRFIRVRGGEYFRDPDAAMKRIIKELEALNIVPDDIENAVDEEGDTLYQRVMNHFHSINNPMETVDSLGENFEEIVQEFVPEPMVTELQETECLTVSESLPDDVVVLNENAVTVDSGTIHLPKKQNGNSYLRRQGHKKRHYGTIKPTTTVSEFNRSSDKHVDIEDVDVFIPKTHTQLRQEVTERVQQASANAKLQKAKTAELKEENLSPFNEGDRVRHVKFGVGTVKYLFHVKSDVNPANDYWKVTVHFDGYVTKEFHYPPAPLTKIHR